MSVEGKNSAVTMVDTSIAACSSGDFGGAVFVNGAAVSMLRGLVRNCESKAGAIYNTQLGESRIVLQGVLFEANYNRAAFQGPMRAVGHNLDNPVWDQCSLCGAICLRCPLKAHPEHTSVVILEANTFINNRAPARAAALCSLQG